MSRILAGHTAETLASIEADLAASTLAAATATKGYTVASEAHFDMLRAGDVKDLDARVAKVNELAQKMADALRQKSRDRYRLAQYRIAARRGTREDYLLKRPR